MPLARGQWNRKAKAVPYRRRDPPDQQQLPQPVLRRPATAATNQTVAAAQTGPAGQPAGQPAVHRFADGRLHTPEPAAVIRMCLDGIAAHVCVLWAVHFKMHSPPAGRERGRSPCMSGHAEARRQHCLKGRGG